MKKPFNRNDVSGCRYEVLSKGRWANADLYRYRHAGKEWVVKDFMPCHSLVRRTWGRIMVRREFNALMKLSGIPGIPEEAFLLDDYALCYRYIEGKTLRDTAPEIIKDDFFLRLEELVFRMHALNRVHLDIRNRRNILVVDTGEPALLDFQNCIDLERVPRFLHKLLKEIDFSGVYKNWNKYKPETLDSTRMAKLSALNRKRSFWLFKGYPSWMKGDRRS